jgi:hypothetical protein
MPEVRKLILIISILLINVFCCMDADAAQAYDSYTYNYWGEAVYAPQAYIPDCEIKGESIGTGGFKKLTDIFVGKDRTIYLLDSGDNRIVITNENWKLLKEIRKFVNNGKEDGFNNPQGLFVTDEGNIYVADTDNGRIVELDREGRFVREIGRPESSLFGENYIYKPGKLVLDKALRIYAVAQNVNEGLVELDTDGKFQAFIGAAKVTPSISDIFYKSIATKEQRNRMKLFVPTEYNNIFLDNEGFIWGTVSALNATELNAAIRSRSRDDKVAPVRRLNSTGTDVLRRNGNFPPAGEIDINVTGKIQGPSTIIDVTVDDFGVYSLLDLKRGRVFTYDSDGNLMYIFGALGKGLGTFSTPNSVAKLGDKMLITDSKRNVLVVFEMTEYGRAITEAVKFYKNGDYARSSSRWKKALDLNSNFELAYQGIGKCSLREEKYKDAMEYFKLANDRYYYSKAFKLYRKGIIEKNFGYFAIFVLLLSIAIYIFQKRKRRIIMRRNGGIWHELD